MKKWEYMCQRLPYDQPDLEQGLDKLGKDGWELCVSASVAANFQKGARVPILIFKREIPEPPAEPREATTEEVLAHIHGFRQ